MIMKRKTKIELQIFYGELMQIYESSFCYLEKNKAKIKMDAINILLDIKFYK